VPPEEPRSAGLIQVFFAGRLEDREVLEIFRTVAASLRGLLETYRRIPEAVQPYHDMVGSPRESFFWMLTLECGMAGARAQLEWVESVIRRLENRDYRNLPEVLMEEGS
jgi:hypothetical protein